MAYFDGTGPKGKGPRTGRGMGNCDKVVKDTLVGGTGLMVGSMAMGKIAATSTNPTVASIASSGQAAFGIGSIAMPIGAAKGVMGSLDSLANSTRRKKK